MIKTFCVLAFLAVSVKCEFLSQPRLSFPTLPSLMFNESDYVDRVLANVQEGIIKLHLDPIQTLNLTLKVNNYSIALTNGEIRGLSNIHRVGDVTVNATFFNSKLRSAFAVYNLSSDEDVQIHTNTLNYSNGHIHMDCDNITVYQVYKLEWFTLTATLDEFELDIGNCNFNATGLGERAQNDSAVIDELFKKTKQPILDIFNVVVKALVNAALVAVRTAIIG